MVQIDDKIISLNIFERKFICDLGKCHGVCCVEGESGAPLEDEEIEILEKIYPEIEPYLSSRSKKEIKKQGKWVIDPDGDKVTPIIKGKECVYAYFEKDGTCKCAIEKAHLDGKISFKKPISCHLYPIRVDTFNDFEALNYHHWPICEPARILGSKNGTPVFQFLKEPIIRKYGDAFYNEMVDVEKELRRRELL